MKSSKTKRKAFTLLEVMIVMSVIVAMLSIGTYSLIRFRNYTIFQSNYRDFISNIKSVQNSARNSVISPKKYNTTGEPILSTVDAYMIYIENSEYSAYYCNYGTPKDSVFLCGKESELINIEVSEKVTISSIDCLGVGFKRSSGDIFLITAALQVPQYNYSTTGTCVVKVEEKDFGSSKTIAINATTNTIVTQD
jgi:prepilin-type N-terminal cleavage/methylation domain-containing protein